MSFKLTPNQSLRKRLRRVMSKQIDSAKAHLSGSNRSSRDSAIHKTRKTIKRLRAVLRLVRPVIRADTYRKGNVALQMWLDR